MGAGSTAHEFRVWMGQQNISAHVKPVEMPAELSVSYDDDADADDNGKSHAYYAELDTHRKRERVSEWVHLLRWRVRD